jgi:UDP-N-acetyl-2-amino-2-deoxyglucuronate dehydrogenase
MRFAITGVAGFVAPRHLDAIKYVGGELVAALDPHDGVGILDRYSRQVEFFTDSDRFERYLQKQSHSSTPVDWLSICSPNHKHDSQALMGLRAGANVICEKPLTLTPWNLDALEKAEQQYGRRVYTVLQLRLMPSLLTLKNKILFSSAFHDIHIDYVTPRGRWYLQSWKGDIDKSGGVTTNIGIHLLDMLIWLLGCPPRDVQVATCSETSSTGRLVFPNAVVRWSLSTEGDAPKRLIEIDGETVDFNDGFADLHKQIYVETLAGRGFSISDARPAVELAYRIRTSKVLLSR